MTANHVPQRSAASWRVALRLAGAAALFTSGAAQAACIHTNQLWSCIDANGNTEQLYCMGSGVVLTCMDFAGGWILVAPHEVLSQITSASDNDVASALAAQNPAGPNAEQQQSQQSRTGNKRSSQPPPKPVNPLPFP